MGRTYPYLLYLPREYGGDSQRWPLLLFLHGTGERGTDLQAVSSWGPPKLIAEGRDYSMIVASPQCPENASWNATRLTQTLDELSVKLAIDRDRVYVTGFSMGGFATWELAASAPDRVAAIVPVAGGGNPSTAAKLKNLPIWAFHGEEDEAVSASASRDMIDAVRAAGGAPRLTIYSGLGHGVCDRTYQSQDLFDWLLSQKRGRRGTHSPTRP